MSVTSGAELRFARLARYVLILSATAALCVTSTAHASCRASPLSKAESAAVLKFIPVATDASRNGGSLSVVPWKPQGGFRTDTFYLFRLLSSAGDNTPLGNGVLGYYGVNKWTGDVLELNSTSPFVVGGTLKRYQSKVIRNHCLARYIPSRRLNDLQASK